MSYAVAKITAAEPVVDRPPEGVPMIGDCLSCGWSGAQAIAIYFRASIESGSVDTECSQHMTACHKCEPMVLETLERIEMEDDL